MNPLKSLIELIYERAVEQELGKLFFSFLQDTLYLNEYEYIDKILNQYFKEGEPKEVVDFTRKRKLMRRKHDWYEKAIAGYENYQKHGEIKRGIYRHLVDFHLEMEKMEKEKGPVLFRKLAHANSSEEVIKGIIKELKKWLDTEQSLLIQYPFFQSLGPKLQEKGLEVDGVILIGEAFVYVLENQNHLIWKDEDKSHFIDEQTYIKKMPSIFLDTPISAIGDKTKYEMDNEKEWKHENGGIVEIKKKQKHELPDNFKMFVDKVGLEKGTKKIRTPDMADEMLFIQMLEHRDEDFQKNKRIFVYLSELIGDRYASDNAKNYKILRERLWKLGHFRMAKIYEDQSFTIRSLFQELSVKKDQQGRWYVYGLVSDEIRDIILKDNFVKIYNEKINELNSPLATHLAFLVQKERILHHQKGKNMISFRLTWADFQTSMRLNKRSRQENMKEIAKALSEIQDKNFLIQNFYRDGSLSFIVNCYNLNEYELKDRSSIRSIFQKNSPSQLLETSIEPD